MERGNGNSNYLEHSYNDGISATLIAHNSFVGKQNGKTLRQNQKLQGMEKNEMKNKQILLQYNLMNQNYNSMDFNRMNFGAGNANTRHSLDFDRNPPTTGIASLKEKLRK